MRKTFHIRRSLPHFVFTFATAFVLPFAAISTAAQASALDLDGKSVNPFQAARGKVLVLIFVRTDCPVSNRYARTIQELSARTRANAVFFLVYPDAKESPEVIRKHDREFGYRLTALRDPQHVLVKRSNAQITPEAAVFDAHEKLVYHGRIDNLYEDFGHSRRTATTHELADAITSATAGETREMVSAPAVGCYISDLE